MRIRAVPPGGAPPPPGRVWLGRLPAARRKALVPCLGLQPALRLPGPARAPRRRYMASGGNDGLVSLWDLDDMMCLRTFARPDQTVRALSFSHEAKWLAYGSEDNGGMVDIVNVQTGARAGAGAGRAASVPCPPWRGAAGV